MTRPSTKSITKNAVPMMPASSHRRCARDRHIRGSESLDDSIFALDLMSRLEQSPRRFLTHHETSVRSFEQEGGIRLSADELLNGERAAEVRHVIAQVTFERGFVEAMIIANCCDVILEVHHLSPWPPLPSGEGERSIGP